MQEPFVLISHQLHIWCCLIKGVTDVPSNLLVTYHGVTWKTHYVGVSTFHEPDVNLVCLFDRLPDDTLLYDVTWYVDDTEILKHQTVTSNTSDLALLKGTQILAKGKKANSMVTHLLYVCCYLFQINEYFWFVSFMVFNLMCISSAMDAA